MIEYVVRSLDISKHYLVVPNMNPHIESRGTLQMVGYGRTIVFGALNQDLRSRNARVANDEWQTTLESWRSVAQCPHRFVRKSVLFPVTRVVVMKSTVKLQTLGHVGSGQEVGAGLGDSECLTLLSASSDSL